MWPVPSPTQRLGAHQEAVAERALSRAGYQIAERNWRGAGGEIDRIAWDGETLVFVEIRARTRDRGGDPAATVGPAKQRHVIRAAAAYLMALSPLPPVRFDVVAIVGDRVEIIPDAFEVEPGRDLPLL